VKQGISTGAVLIAMSIVFAGATAMAAPMGLDGSQKKHETTHRPSLEQIIRHKVMGVIGMVEGGIASWRPASQDEGRHGRKSSDGCKGETASSNGETASRDGCKGERRDCRGEATELTPCCIGRLRK